MEDAQDLLVVGLDGARAADNELRRLGAPGLSIHSPRTSWARSS